MRIIYDDQNRLSEIHLEEGESPETENEFIREYFKHLTDSEKEITIRQKQSLEKSIEYQKQSIDGQLTFQKNSLNYVFANKMNMQF